jgi:hypothetical protein
MIIMNIFNFWRRKMANNLENVNKALQEKLISELGFRVNPDEKKSIVKDISQNYGMVLYHDAEYPLTFGFYHYNGKNFSPAQSSWLRKEVFERWEFSEFFDDIYDWDGWWICKRFKHKGFSNEDAINFLFSRYQWLEQTVRYLEIT